MNPEAQMTRSELEAGFQALPPPPKDAGFLRAIVRRLAPGLHQPLDQTLLSLEEGVSGDEWNRREPRDPAAQLAVMRHDIASLIAHGREPAEFGDNLLVELDVSAANLPAGTRLRLGEATVEVTPKPRAGCSKLRRLFGEDAVAFLNEPARRDQRLRGVYWKVVAAGRVKVGGAVEVLERGPRSHP